MLEKFYTLSQLNYLSLCMETTVPGNLLTANRLIWLATTEERPDFPLGHNAIREHLAETNQVSKSDINH